MRIRANFEGLKAFIKSLPIDPVSRCFYCCQVIHALEEFLEDPEIKKSREASIEVRRGLIQILIVATHATLDCEKPDFDCAQAWLQQADEVAKEIRSNRDVEDIVLPLAAAHVRCGKYLTAYY